MKEDYANALEVKNISKKYPGFELKDINMVLPKGCIMGIIGENGAGKTTTIKAMLNIIKVDSGSINIFELDHIKEETIIKENIGVVFDEMGFPKQFTPKHLNKMFKHIYKTWDEEQFFEYLTQFGLPHNRKSGRFSRGMQMKLQIAVALSHDAKLLILDEPTSGLDPIVRNEVLDIFLKYVENEEHSILISSHITSDLEKIADYITFIDKGSILFSDDRISIMESFGLLHVEKEKLKDIDREHVVGVRKSSFGADVLVKNPDKVKKKYPDYSMDKPNLEDVMVFHVLGKNADTM